jgi:uncharacterized membrane protein YccC
VTVAVLFNLLLPVGWKVGELRLEDVALGCLVSVLVGAVLWPRGAAPIVGDNLADAYRAGASYLREAVAWVSGLREERPEGGSAAMTAGLRLDEAVRGYLSEQGTKHLPRLELWRLIGGTMRLRLTAHAVAGLPRSCAKADRAVASMTAERTDALVAWYEQLASCVGRPGRETGPLAEPSFTGSDGGAVERGAIWLQEHLAHLAEHLEVLVTPANHLAQARRQPWWR